MSIWAGLSLQRRPTRVPLETLPIEGKLARTSREKVLEKCCTLSWSLDSLKTASLSKNPKGHPPHHPVWPLIPEDRFLLSARDCFPEQPQGGHALPLGPGLLLSSLSFHPPPGVGRGVCVLLILMNSAWAGWAVQAIRQHDATVCLGISETLSFKTICPPSEVSTPKEHSP